MVFAPSESRESIIRFLFFICGALYFVGFIGVYRAAGSVNEWLHISTIGMNGGDHWGILSHTYSLPTFARAIGVTTPEAWRAMVQVIAIASTGLLIGTLNKISARPLDFLIVLLAVQFSPIVRAVFNGQADYDGITLIGISLILLASLQLSTSASYVAAIIVGLLAGITNPQQGAAALTCLAITMVALDHSRVRQIGAAFGALVAAAIVMRIMLWDENIPGRGEDSDLLQYIWAAITNWSKFSANILHLYAGFWVILITALVTVGKQRGLIKAGLLIVALLLIPLIPFLMLGDGSRIFSLIMAPACIFTLTRVTPKWSTRKATIIVIVAVVVQIIYVATGQLDFEPEFPTMFENLSSRPNPLP